MTEKLPKPFARFQKNHPEMAEAYEALSAACHAAGPLSPRERALVKLAVAVGARLEGAVHAQVRKGLKAGLSPEDVRHAVYLSLTTIGFPSMMAALTWVGDLLPTEEKPGKKNQETRKKKR